ncbi:MAG: electron transfer flavoprotein beta subunit [Candidatus Magnetoglobus multicellularis str. Araruama]|uniref:Electron transfer flavoprotein beta subunit n=1 Tax=Candidatus Magnetoglobus multicellularis str. Araruama TaxID=890399 RepID=A0A1V1P3L9_9BACT|nr:MAG: electron transfer flavoprotein beta subunit [Candidatus Magnetoglobus multicellularis str. Araruama]
MIIVTNQNKKRKLVVCIKQVPMVSELPWNSKTGTLRRELAEGMMNPSCKSALEAALQIKQKDDATILVISMGPPAAEEVLRESLAMGADHAILLSDKRLAGSDTLITSHALAQTIQTYCKNFDLILCGCHTSDSETAQVGPQIAEELDVPCVAYVDQLTMKRSYISISRKSDAFVETLEMDLPGLVTVSNASLLPRYVPLKGLQNAFQSPCVEHVTVEDIGLSPDFSGANLSPTKIVNVYSPNTKKNNVVLQGSPRYVVDQLFEKFGDKISSVLEKDIKTA